jgi:glycosyltransferase involved in cell wall biosynthesis
VRIAFLDSWIQSNAEGSGTAVGIGGLLGALQTHGHRVTRLSPFVDWPRSLTMRRLLFNLHIPALLRRLPYDLVVGVDIDGFLYAGGRGASGGAPYLASIKGVLAEEAQHERGSTRLLLWTLSRLEQRNARHARAVLTTSDYCRAAIERQYGVPAQRVCLVPEGIDLARWQQAGTPPVPTRNGSTILCVSRQYPRKRIADLLRAFLLVRQAVPQARLIIVGDGLEHARLRRLVSLPALKGGVFLLGALPDAAVLHLYRQADVFCLPSVQEGFGIVFLEAMASGLPVVATRAAAIPEVVPHRQAGLLVPPGDVSALAAALVELLSDQEQRAAYAAFGRAHVQQYDWRCVAEQFLAQVAPFVRA